MPVAPKMSLQLAADDVVQTCHFTAVVAALSPWLFQVPVLELSTEPRVVSVPEFALTTGTPVLVGTLFTKVVENEAAYALAGPGLPTASAIAPEFNDGLIVPWPQPVIATE